MHEKKAGTLKNGRSGKKVTSRKQAIQSVFQRPVKAEQRFLKRNLHQKAVGKNRQAEKHPVEERRAMKVKAPSQTGLYIDLIGNFLLLKKFFIAFELVIKSFSVNI